MHFTMLILIVILVSFLHLLNVNAQNVQKRAFSTDPLDYKVDIKKYYDSWAKKQEDSTISFAKLRKAEKKYLMLAENNADEISEQAWSHYRELNELKGKIKRLEEKRDEANYKFDAYSKLAHVNFAQRRSDISRVAQAGLYEAAQLGRISGDDIALYVKHFIRGAKQNPRLLYDTVRNQERLDPNRKKVIKQLQASYLTRLSPKFFDLMKFERKKKALKEEWESGRISHDAEAVDKNQRNYQKADLKVSAIEDVSNDAAVDLSRIYNRSYWRHNKNISDGIQRIKLMQVKQDKWTEAARKAGAENVPASPYILEEAKDSEASDVVSIGDSSHNQLRYA